MLKSMTPSLTGALIVMSAAIAIGGNFPAVCGAQNQTPAASNSGFREQNNVQLIRGYRKWTKVNLTPILMQPAPAAQCAGPSPSQLPSPHLQKYITIYVNNEGKEAMLSQRMPHFPVGTVLVKEKLSTADSKSPELMTVMFKRAKGYNLACDDWEYLVYDGSGKNVKAHGKLEKCQSCHQQQLARSADYVFRDYYLSQDQRMALK